MSFNVTSDAEGIGVPWIIEFFAGDDHDTNSVRRSTSGTKATHKAEKLGALEVPLKEQVSCRGKGQVLLHLRLHCWTPKSFLR